MWGPGYRGCAAHPGYHGRAGQGGAFNYPAPALAAIELPVEAFQAFLREPPNDMPGYSTALLSDKKAADM